MYYTLSQAAKITGKSKGTISKYLSTGKLSYILKDKNGYQIDPSELFRVFPKCEPQTPQNEQTRTHGNPAEIITLQHEVERLNSELRIAQERIVELQSDKLFLQGELSKTTTLLSSKTEKPSESPQTRKKSLLAMLVAKKPR